MSGPIGSDAFAGALETGLPFLSDATDNTTYTVEPGEPDPYAGNPDWGGWAVNRTAWWTFTPTADGDVQFHSQRSYYTDGSYPGKVMDTLIALYTGDAIGSLTLVTNGHADTNAGGDYTPWVCAAHVTAGTTYRVQVSSIYSEDISYVLTVVQQPTATSTDPVALDPVTASRISTNGGGQSAWQSSTTGDSATYDAALSAVWNLTGGMVDNATTQSVNQGISVTSDATHQAEWFGMWASLLLDDSNAPSSGTATAPTGPTPAYDSAAVWTRELVSQDATVELSPNATASGLGPNPAWKVGDTFHVIEGASGFDPAVPYKPPVRTAGSVAGSPQLLRWATSYSKDDCQVGGQREIAHFTLDPNLTTVALTVLDDYTYTQTPPTPTAAGIDVGYVANFAVTGTYRLSYSYTYVPVAVAGGGGGAVQSYRAPLRLHPRSDVRLWPRPGSAQASGRTFGGYY